MTTKPPENNYDDPSIDEIAAMIIHDQEFEEHREHIEPLAARVLELLGPKSPVLTAMVCPDNSPIDHDIHGPTYIWIRGAWARHFNVCTGHVWVQGRGILPTPSPAILARSTEIWPEGFHSIEGWSARGKPIP